MIQCVTVVKVGVLYFLFIALPLDALQLAEPESDREPYSTTSDNHSTRHNSPLAMAKGMNLIQGQASTPLFMSLTRSQAQALHDKTLPIAAHKELPWSEQCNSCNEFPVEGRANEEPLLRRMFPVLSELQQISDAKQNTFNAINTTSKKLAVLLFGEAFRNSGNQTERGTCNGDSFSRQETIFHEHAAFFSKLKSFGYDVDVFAVASACSGRPRLEGATILGEWYKEYLRAPIIVPTDHSSGSDVFPNAQFRKRQLVAHLMDAYLNQFGGTYDHVLQIRWDLHVNAKNWNRCFLDDNVILDTRRGRLSVNWGDWDRALLIPRKYVKCWTCLLMSDRPFLTNEPDKLNEAASSNISAAHTRCGEKGFVGEEPPGQCWARHCRFDVCLHFFPQSARNMSQTCSAFVRSISKKHESIIGHKVPDGHAAEIHGTNVWPSYFGQLRDVESSAQDLMALRRVPVALPTDPFGMETGSIVVDGESRNGA